MVKRHVYDVRVAALNPHNHGRCKSTLESCNRQLSTVKLWLWNCAGRGLTFLFLWGDFMLNTIMVMQRFCACEWKKKKPKKTSKHEGSSWRRGSGSNLRGFLVSSGYLLCVTGGHLGLRRLSGVLWFCGWVGEPTLFKPTVSQHPAKSQAHNSTNTFCLHHGPCVRGENERATHTVTVRSRATPCATWKKIHRLM